MFLNSNPTDTKLKISKLMKIAIMQPYFLPYLGYFSLIKSTDKWIVNDEVQMIHKGWVDRNRILKQYGGWHYIRVPLVKYPYTTSIKDIRIRNHEAWKAKILAQLGHYKKRAPYYWNTIAFLKDAFAQKFEFITDQNVYLLKRTCEYIGIKFKYDILSDLDLNLEKIEEPDEWSLQISKQLGCDHYINPILGMNFYNREKYADNDITLNFLQMKQIPLYHGDMVSIDGLSIVDVMMFNSPEEINEMLDNYDLI